MKHCNAKLTALACVVFFSSAATVGRATAYTSEALWRAAVSNTYALETFDSLAAGSDVFSLPALGITFDQLNDGSQPTVQRYSQTGGVVKSGPHNLLNDRDFALPARGPYVIRPSNPLDLLFGIGLWNVGGDDTLRMSIYDSSDVLIEQVVSASGIGFFGIVNSGGANKVVIDFVGGNGYAPVDDLQTAVRRTFVPSTPDSGSTMALLAISVIAIGAFRRRHNNG